MEKYTRVAPWYIEFLSRQERTIYAGNRMYPIAHPHRLPVMAGKAIARRGTSPSPQPLPLPVWNEERET